MTSPLGKPMPHESATIIATRKPAMKSRKRQIVAYATK